jgi:hypothetical protein
MLLVRFAALVLATVAAIVGVALLNTWWIVVLAVVVTLALLALTVLDLAEVLSDDGDRSLKT